jgi:hypothetical protein
MRTIRFHLVLLLSLSAVSAVAQEVPRTANPAGAAPASDHRLPVSVLPPGPWGSLEYYRIPLTCPSDSLANLRTPSQRVEWCIPATNQTGLEAELLSAGLTGTEIAIVLKGATVLATSELMRVFPSEEAVLGMGFETRRKLYQHLGTIRENRFHRRPLYIATENLSSWFDGSGIPRPVIEDIAKLAYPTPRGVGYFFADLPFTLRRTDSLKEERLLLSGLTRRQGLVVRLRVTRENLSPEIGNYWNAGYKNKAVMPILDAVAHANDGAAIDISHLLPATPRQYLNRFPEPSDAVDGRLPDWFWTCYNFFRFTPRDVYADSPERDTLLLEEFVPGIPPLQFGDLVMLNSGTKIIHGCIHIADDIVFTKNGADFFSPWVLMRLEDVVASQDLIGDVTLSAYRKVPAQAPPEP